MPPQRAGLPPPEPAPARQVPVLQLQRALTGNGSLCISIYLSIHNQYIFPSIFISKLSTELSNHHKAIPPDYQVSVNAIFEF